MHTLPQRYGKLFGTCQYIITSHVSGPGNRIGLICCVSVFVCVCLSDFWVRHLAECHLVALGPVVALCPPTRFFIRLGREDGLYFEHWMLEVHEHSGIFIYSDIPLPIFLIRIFLNNIISMSQKPSINMACIPCIHDDVI